MRPSLATTSMPHGRGAREFRNIDVTANWTRIPDFGDWGAFFHPETQK